MLLCEQKCGTFVFYLEEDESLFCQIFLHVTCKHTVHLIHHLLHIVSTHTHTHTHTHTLQARINGLPCQRPGSTWRFGGHLSSGPGSELAPLQLPVYFHIVVCSWTWTLRSLSQVSTDWATTTFDDWSLYSVVRHWTPSDRHTSSPTSGLSIHTDTGLPLLQLWYYHRRIRETTKLSPLSACVTFT